MPRGAANRAAIPLSVPLVPAMPVHLCVPQPNRIIRLLATARWRGLVLVATVEPRQEILDEIEPGQPLACNACSVSLYSCLLMRGG